MIPASTGRFLYCAAGALLLWLLTVCGWHAMSALPSPDDAMFLSVPKNWLNGYGWATSYSERIPFNPDFTAGPTLLLPAAALIALFGNTTWIAGITGLLVNGSVLALCLWRIQRSWPHPAAFSLALVSLCVALRPDDLPTLMGYYTVSLLFLLMTLLAFDTTEHGWRSAAMNGVLAALALHTKPLALPAMALLLTVQLLHAKRHQQACATELCRRLLAFVLPIALLHGGWWWWRDSVLSALPTAQQAIWHEYAAAFFSQHGSGWHSWQQTQDALLHVLRNVDRNGFHIEAALAQYHIRHPFLTSGTGDVHHLVGMTWLFLIVSMTVTFSRRAWQTNTPIDWALATLGIGTLLYCGWFLGFAMAMSAGHAYFPVQWSLWLFGFGAVHALCQRCRATVLPVCLVAGCVACILWLTPAASRSLLGFTQPNTPSAGVTPQLQARDYLLNTRFDAPLTGCGYDGYPRHLEYLLPQSQNFRDCYDMIEDHAQLDTEAYYRDNGLDKTQVPDAMAHFRAHVGTPGLRFQFAWKPEPLHFTLVLSLSSLRQVYRLEPILRACQQQRRYINQDVMVLACHDGALKQRIDLNVMMSEIAINQRWYRTRL